MYGEYRKRLAPGVRDKLGGLESEMTKSQVAKSKSNPKDQAPKPEEELSSSRFPTDCGIWFPGHWGFVKSVSPPELSRIPTQSSPVVLRSCHTPRGSRREPR
jgi:hypothetical protein